MNDISVYDLRLHCTFNYKYGSCAIHISNKKNSNKPIVTVGNFICINKSGKVSHLQYWLRFVFIIYFYTCIYQINLIVLIRP